VVILAGFIVMELEILGTRIISPIFGSTIYVWTSLIGITLTFLALGYWYGGKLADKGKITINTLGLIILLLGIYISLLPRISRLVLYFSNELNIIWGPLLSSLMILSLPVFFLGFVVPTSVKFITRSLAEVGSRAGEIYSLATIGSIIGTFVTGFFLISYFGVVKTSLITGLALIIVSLIIIEPKIKFFSLLLIPVLFVPLSYPSEILESFDSYYGQIRIMRHGEDLRLYAGVVPQTAINIETKENGIS
jgi:predicted membrane-bound spermidine synthase